MNKIKFAKFSEHVLEGSKKILMCDLLQVVNPRVKILFDLIQIMVGEENPRREKFEIQFLVGKHGYNSAN